MNQSEEEQPGDRPGVRPNRMHEDGPGYHWPGTPQESASRVYYAGSFVACVPCPTCGTAVVTTAMGCPNCGTVYFSPRSKRTAVVLALLLTFWTWYYTYRKDRWKFWVGLAADVLGVLLPHAELGVVLLTGVWTWAIVDAAVKPASWYRCYPSGR